MLFRSPFFELRVLVDPLEDLPLLDFFAADRLRAFVVGISPPQSPRLVWLDSEPGPRAKWSLMPYAGVPADDALANALTHSSLQRLPQSNALHC